MSATTQRLTAPPKLGLGPSRAPTGRLAQALPAALALTVLAVYASSLGGGFSSYDDPWLIEHNAALLDPSPGRVRGFFFDFSVETRRTLGAEYLPLRDLSHWLELRLFGASAPGMRAVSLGLYVAACLLLRSALRRALPARPWVAEICAWTWALHPVHAESVAWLAGRKDVLALVCVAGALRAYLGAGRARLWAAAWVLGAVLSKSMTVVAPGLLLAADVLARRRPHWPALGASLTVSALVFLLHRHVGGLVGMVQEPLGGSRVATFWSMGPVWLRYVELAVWPPSSSVVQEVPVLQGPSVASVAGWVVLLGCLAAAGACCARWLAAPQRLGFGPAAFASAALFFAVSLLPVSQLIFPLQNVMADRYAFLAVLGLGLGLGALPAALGRAGWALTLAALVALAGFSGWRAWLFADDVRLFSDAAAKTSRSPVPDYQLGQVREARGELELARAAYARAFSRPGPPAEPRRRAANNLARLLVAEGDLAGAERVLSVAREDFPNDPKLLGNLVKVVARRGDAARARRLFEELNTRFPEWVGQRVDQRAADD